MTFTKEEIENMEVSDGDEWQYPEYGETTCNVMLFVDDFFREKACKFFGVSYFDVCDNGWVDVYAFIDVKTEFVKTILFIVTPNNNDVCEEKELEISITNHVEAKLIYEQLMKTEGITEFIEDCKKLLEERGE